jgi:putative ABC transport system ATP-binding protein
VIHLRDVRRGYGEREVLDGVDLDVGRGEVVALVGRSGAGKTTLLNVVAGLDSGYSGTVELDGHDLTSLGDAELADLRNRTVGVVFQAFHLLDHVSVAGNVALPGLFARGETATGRREEARRASEVLHRVGLGGRARSRPAQLSGGERQRVALARALYLAPPVLLCDELTGNLDGETAGEVIRILLDAARQDGCAVVIVTHDEAIVGSADRVLRLSDGRLEAQSDAGLGGA